jgi:hypothetical protein
MLTINDIKKLPIVFIIGRGRSGTSLLQTIFDANPGVITANESLFILHLRQKYQSVNIWGTEKINEFITDLYKDKTFAYLWGIDKEVLKNKISAYPSTELSFAVLCKLVYLTVSSPFPKDAIELIVDKNPKHSFFINELKSIFPEAKFIHLIRDYRDNIISCRKTFKIRDVASLAQRWKRQNMHIEARKGANKAIFYTLQYEQLVQQPEKYVNELCTFTNITFSQSMFDFHKTTSKIYSKEAPVNEVMTDIVQKIHRNLLNPINSNQVNKWKNELSNAEIEIIDYVTGSYAKKYGYLPTTRVIKPYFFLSSLKSYFAYYVSYFVYKVYFRLPMSIRDLSKTFSMKLYKTFGYLNKYNKVGVLYQKD